MISFFFCVPFAAIFPNWNIFLSIYIIDEFFFFYEWNNIGKGGILFVVAGMCIFNEKLDGFQCIIRFRGFGNIISQKKKIGWKGFLIVCFINIWVIEKSILSFKGFVRLDLSLMEYFYRFFDDVGIHIFRTLLIIVIIYNSISW